MNWTVTPEDADLILQIVERAEAAWPRHAGKFDFFGTTLDITAVHANGRPLDLAALLAADDFEFMHDVGGIMIHIDRDTGTLRNCFVPRFARREVTAK